MKTLKKIILLWPVVIISFIIWPIGLVLLYLKLYSEGGKLKANKVFFWILAVCCYLMVMGSAGVFFEKGNYDPSYIIFGFLFLAGGIASTNKAIKFGKEYNYYQNYVEEIGIKKTIFIEELAEKMNYSIEKVEEDISKMVSYKIIEGYINDENKLILLRNSDLRDAASEIEEEKTMIFSVECKNCGATNQYIENKKNRCEFCGSILENKIKL